MNQNIAKYKKYYRNLLIVHLLINYIKFFNSNIHFQHIQIHTFEN